MLKKYIFRWSTYGLWSSGRELLHYLHQEFTNFFDFFARKTNCIFSRLFGLSLFTPCHVDSVSNIFLEIHALEVFFNSGSAGAQGFMSHTEALSCQLTWVRYFTNESLVLQTDEVWNERTQVGKGGILEKLVTYISHKQVSIKSDTGF